MRNNRSKARESSAIVRHSQAEVPQRRRRRPGVVIDTAMVANAFEVLKDHGVWWRPDFLLHRPRFDY